MHGLYWYVALTHEYVRWLHISVLELLASAFSTIVFAPLLPPRTRLVLGSDAAATVTTLTRETESSPMLTLTHHALLQCPQFAAVVGRVDLGHLRGDSNFSDPVSRGKWDTFYQLCRNLRLRPIELAVPECCTHLLERMLLVAKERGIEVRPNWYKSSSPSVPPELLSLVEPPPRLTPAKRVREGEPAAHVPLHATALELGTANNGAGARQPFAHMLSACCGRLQRAHSVPRWQCAHLERCSVCGGARCERCWQGEALLPHQPACSCTYLPSNLNV